MAKKKFYNVNIWGLDKADKAGHGCVLRQFGIPATSMEKAALAGVEYLEKYFPKRANLAKWGYWITVELWGDEGEEMSFDKMSQVIFRVKKGSTDLKLFR